MCQYYMHSYLCKHTSYSFARFCDKANLVQNPCGSKQVWHTIRMDDACDECLMCFPDKCYPRPAHATTRRAAAAVGRA